MTFIPYRSFAVVADDPAVSIREAWLTSLDPIIPPDSTLFLAIRNDGASLVKIVAAADEADSALEIAAGDIVTVGPYSSRFLPYLLAAAPSSCRITPTSSVL